MTDYEMISAAQGYIAIGMTDALNNFTMLGAYLVAGYLAAHRISLAMAVFVTALFVVASINGVVLYYTQGEVLQALFDHMHSEALAGKALQWAPIAQRARAPNVFIIGYVALIVMVLATLGSVYFFFECRWRNMKAEAAAKP